MESATRTEDRIRHAALRERICFAPEAAQLIKKGYRVGMSGFTGSGYPKLVPQALAEHILREHSRGSSFRISVMTGASTSSNWTARWPWWTASSCACRTIPIPPRARRSTPGRWNTSTSTWARWPST